MEDSVKHEAKRVGQRQDMEDAELQVRGEWVYEVRNRTWKMLSCR